MPKGSCRIIYGHKGIYWFMLGSLKDFFPGPPQQKIDFQHLGGLHNHGNTNNCTRISYGYIRTTQAYDRDRTGVCQGSALWE